MEQHHCRNRVSRSTWRGWLAGGLTPGRSGSQLPSVFKPMARIDQHMVIREAIPRARYPDFVSRRQASRSIVA